MSRIKSIGTLVAVLVSILLLLLLIVLPALASLLAKETGVPPAWLSDLLTISDGFTRWFMLVFLIAWIFFLGGTFASFLNVVAARVPKGRSILGSSHCPNCDIKLSFKDNIPIVGWMKNGGKCSNCQNPIAVRYLIVEVVLGLIFLAIAGLVISQVTLPFHKAAIPSYWYNLILNPRIELIQLIVFYWALMLVLYTFALIELEWLKIPISVWLFGMAAGLLLLAIWPLVQVVDWQFPFEISNFHRIVNLIAYVVCGVAAGAVFGWILDQAKFVADQPNSFVFGATIVGLFLGWQSALVVTFLTSILIMLATQRSPANTFTKNLLHSPHSNLLLATLIHLATWRWLQLL